MIRAHKIRLNPTPEQATYFAKAAGTARFCFNWAVAEWKRRYEAGEKPSALKLRTQFHAIRREQFPWSYEVTKCAVEGAFMDVAAAFKNFFQGRKAGRKTGYPRFKSKKRSRQSFYLANDKFSIGDHWIDVPKLGRVNMAENLVRRIVGRMLSATNVVGTNGMFHAYSTYPIPRKRKATIACGEGHVGESHQFFEWLMQGVYGER